MSRALPGTHLCLAHQGNHSHYAPHNCEICKLEAQRDKLLKMLNAYQSAWDAKDLKAQLMRISAEEAPQPAAEKTRAQCPDCGGGLMIEQFLDPTADMVKDAARYRWLREQNETLEIDSWTVTTHDFTDEDGPERYWVGADLDAAIDAAMSAAQGVK
jgi:hypothetical protein